MSKVYLTFDPDAFEAPPITYASKDAPGFEAAGVNRFIPNGCCVISTSLHLHFRAYLKLASTIDRLPAGNYNFSIDVISARLYGIFLFRALMCGDCPAADVKYLTVLY